MFEKILLKIKIKEFINSGKIESFVNKFVDSNSKGTKALHEMVSAIASRVLIIIKDNEKDVHKISASAYDTIKPIQKLIEISKPVFEKLIKDEEIKSELKKFVDMCSLKK